MKRIIFIIAALFATAQAQTIQTIGAPTTTVVSRGNFRTDSIFYLPKRTKLPSDSGAVRYQISDSSVYYWTGSQWRRLGVHIDTAAMLLPYLRKADTTAMLSPYLKESDTVWLSNRINLKVNIADTSSMLDPYLRGSGTANYLPIFDASRSVINSKVYQSGNHLMFNTTTPSVSAAEYGTMDVNGSENAAYILKVGDAEKSYILSNGTDLIISNNPAGDLIFRNNNATRGRFTSAGQFRVNNLASPSIRLVTADTDGNLAGTVSVTQFIDTTEISTRAWVQRGDDSLGVVIATKVNISDTSSMLSPYLRKVDTTAMLSPYARTSNVNASLALKVNISDTSSMLTNYIRHAGNGLTKSGQALSVDTAAIATRARVQKGIDSVATLASAGVTSVATGYGLSGGTITTTGTIIVDSAIVASRLRVGKVVDSLALVKQNVLTNPVTGSGTTNTLSKFTGSTTIGNTQIFDDGTSVGINTTSPTYRLQINGGSLPFNGTDRNVLKLISSTTTELNFIQRNVSGFIGTRISSGDEITLGSSSTDRLKLTSSGELILNTSGTFTDQGAYTLQVTGSAYFSGNVTATNGVLIGGSGTTNYIQKFTGTNASGNSQLFDNGTNIGVFTASPSFSFDMFKSSTSDFAVRTSANNGSAYVSTYNSGDSSGNYIHMRSYGNSTSTTILGVSTKKLNAIWSDLDSAFAIGTRAATPLVFSTNGTARGRFTGDGELLLNTTTDAGDYKLQVSGNAYVTGTTVLAATSGNVAVGGTTANAKIHLYSNNSTTYSTTNTLTSGTSMHIVNDAAVNNIASTIRLDATGNGSLAAASISGIYSGVATSALTFGTRFSGSSVTEKIRIHGDGGLKFVGQSAAPTAEAGTVYYDTDDNKLKVYNGTTWVDLH